MLDHEYGLLKERLDGPRGERTAFFAFADTVSARNFTGSNEAHGWMGLRFQAGPREATNDIVIHIRMWDRENVLQQQALGIIGVSLIYGAFYLRDDPSQLIESLLDNLGAARIEVDMLRCSGPAFAHVDNRLASLHLVRCGLTNAVMFGPDGDVLQPSEVLYRKAVLVERGSFRPVSHLNVDMLRCACAQFVQEPSVKGKDFVVLVEITMHNLLSTGDLDAKDFLARVDLLGDIGFSVLISNYSEFYRLTSYFRRYTHEMIGVAMGVNHLLEIFNEKYYEQLEGGILENFGRLFRQAVKLYIYPMRQDAFDRYLATGSPVRSGASGPITPPGSEVLITAQNLQVAPHLRHLYAHLLENHYLECLVGFNRDIMEHYSREVLARIQSRDPSWVTMVPPRVAAAIQRRRLFGYTETTAAT
jgi:hypothetical protein